MIKTKTDRRSTPVDQQLDPEVLAFRQQFDERSPLDQLVRQGAQKMLQEAIDAEVLLATRGSSWAKLRVLRMMGGAASTFRGFETFHFWRSALAIKQKAKSLIGTARRVNRKRLWDRVSVNETSSAGGGDGR